MIETPNTWEFEEDNPSRIKDVLFKYLRYWPWFLSSVIICVALAFAYTYYTPSVYETYAKIRILKEANQLNVVSERVTFGDPKISLDNEIESLKSYQLLRNVVEELNLDVSHSKLETLKSTEIWEVPFQFSRKYDKDTLSTAQSFKVTILPEGFRIVDEKGKQYTILNYHNQNTLTTGLPFDIYIKDEIKQDEFIDNKYSLVFTPMKETILDLSENLGISMAEGTKSEVLTLRFTGQSEEKSEAVLNAIVLNFEQDGIRDKQLLSKQTLDVIDKRFVFLSGELDSIETGKQNFKQNNRLSYIEADAGLSLQNKSLVESEVYKMESQISLAQLLKQTVVEEAQYNLLPAEIGVQNTALNMMVADYNKLALQRQKMLPKVGPEHPDLVELSNQLEEEKLNILSSVNVYQTGLKKSSSQLQKQKNIASARFSRIPQKEKQLRSIERQQGIKENLFMLLLQKREEAAIKLASIIPSIKVIDYAVTPIKPISPKKIIVYPLSLLLGAFFPFLILFAKFSIDTKIHERETIEKLVPKVPIVGEIPFLAESKIFEDVNDRSILGESFRILSTNVNYLLPKSTAGKGKVVYVTSSIKNEGKTLVALNLSSAFASMKKKVLLVGADLRNPELHTHFGTDKSTLGLSDYLANPELKFNDYIHEGFGKNDYHKVYLGGTIHSNAPVLLASERFENFMKLAKRDYDYVVIDTAPALLVTDTLLISKFADITLFVVRAGRTDEHLLGFSKNLSETDKLQNMTYVLNGVGSGRDQNSNYGYGYGYEAQKPKKAFFKNGYYQKNGLKSLRIKLKNKFHLDSDK